MRVKELNPGEKYGADVKIHIKLISEVERIVKENKIKGLVVIYNEVNLDGVRVIKSQMSDADCIMNLEALKLSILNNLNK